MSGKYLLAIAALAGVIAPAAAAAQDGSSSLSRAGATAAVVASTDPEQAGGGPMTVERVHSGLLFAPDFKVTRFDGRTSELVGGYGGWLTDKTFFIGAGGYWLANNARDRRLGYGGVVLQWMGRSDAAIGYSIKGLIGGGESTLGQTISETIRVANLRGIDGRQRPSPTAPTFTTQTITSTIRFHQAFFIAEPEADAVIRITKSLRLSLGAGYRLIAADRGADSRLRGPVGTIGLQLGGGY
jgi:hypothetical protein